MTDGRSIVVLSISFLLYLCSTVDSRMIPKGVDSSDGCKVKNKFYGVGQQWSPRGSCDLYTCLKGGAIGAVNCPLVRVPEDSKCHITEGDVTKVWPDCCGQVVCPSDEDIQ